MMYNNTFTRDKNGKNLRIPVEEVLESLSY